MASSRLLSSGNPAGLGPLCTADRAARRCPYQTFSPQGLSPGAEYVST
ncbi:unnamed protein product [Tetraodon nigroviridis]|uniref:(spotted green pufferfish) hypothetical protein n=1 Tax=Tetraodon nigroviridis TaxID=99883 RepID=Q4RFI5_TETNG|nr:unnamed protein product [Tetraodon nigroviridis]